MRILASFFFIGSAIVAQSMTEFGAVAAGSAVGGAGGKPVSNGISAIFGKTDQQAAKAASKETKKQDAQDPPPVKPAPTVAQGGDSGGVPVPPPLRSKRVVASSVPVPEFDVPIEARRVFTVSEVAPALPPPPVMSPDDFRSISQGMTRASILKLGQPSARITMDEDGRLLEIYSYQQNGQRFGNLYLSDGVVSRIQTTLQSE